MGYGVLSSTELRKLIKILDAVEREFVYLFKHVSGGFSEAVMYYYDEDIIDIEVKSGIQSDVENVVYTENLKIDRKTMEIIN